MGRKPDTDLRRGWTTGACAAAAAKAACQAMWSDAPVREVSITLPGGEEPTFAVAHLRQGAGWAEVGITKDAGDDPDVTHGALIIANVKVEGAKLTLKAGSGVGYVTKPGLPISVGEPAINPVPRQMITQAVGEACAQFGKSQGLTITFSIPGGAEIAQRTWNPRLGIEGGLSILGTTGIVRPFSCAAWIASIHRGIDVARASGLAHVAGCTGATSEKVVQDLHKLPDHGMLDMGDFAGGLLKYLAKHPVPRLTIGGGIGKMTKLAQGAKDLHSARSQVDFEALAAIFDKPGLAQANTALEAVGEAPEMAVWAAETGREKVQNMLKGAPIDIDTVVIDRAGKVLARA
ncbi:MAG: cobalt-precorrin-5B (C(1))-methyltransferase [Pseudomonadota bacterium]